MQSYDYVSICSPCLKTYSVLRILSRHLTPGEITGILQLKPDRVFAKGERFGMHPRRRKFTGWFYSTEGLVLSRDTRVHVEFLLGSIGNKRDELEQLVELGCKLDAMNYWLAREQMSPLIDPEQVRRLAEMRIDAWWDVHVDRPDKRRPLHVFPGELELRVE